MFRRKRMVEERLISYGFTKADDGFGFSTEILDGQFRLTVEIAGDGRVNTRIVDAAAGEEYVLHRVAGAAGTFTGTVREAYEGVMLDIAAKCFEPDVFRTAQARELIAYVRDTYGDELEFLWEKFPDNAVWRRKDNNKWYGALLTVSKRKLGLRSDEMIEIIDLRISPDELDRLLDGVRYLPGYHMNKRNWYTICLDGSVVTDEIMKRIDCSYCLAGKK